MLIAWKRGNGLIESEERKRRESKEGKVQVGEGE